MGNGYFRTSQTRKDKRRTKELTYNYVDRVRLAEHSLPCDYKCPTRGSGWRHNHPHSNNNHNANKSISHLDLATSCHSAAAGTNHWAHARHQLRHSRSLDYNHLGERCKDALDIAEFYWRLDPEVEPLPYADELLEEPAIYRDYNYADENYHNGNNSGNIYQPHTTPGVGAGAATLQQAFDFGSDSCSLRRSRSLAVIREETFSDLQITSPNSSRRRSQLIPRARIVNRGFIRERERLICGNNKHHHHHHHHNNNNNNTLSANEQDGNGSVGGSTCDSHPHQHQQLPPHPLCHHHHPAHAHSQNYTRQPASAREADDYYDNLKRLDALALGLAEQLHPWHNDKSDLESLNSDYFKNSLHQQSHELKQQLDFDKLEQAVSFLAGEKPRIYQSRRQQRGAGNALQQQGADSYPETSQSSVFPETTTTSNSDEQTDSASLSEQEYDLKKIEKIYKDKELAGDEEGYELISLTTTTRTRIETTEDEEDEVKRREHSKENTNENCARSGSTLKRARALSENLEKLIAYDSVYLSSEESSDSTFVGDSSCETFERTAHVTAHIEDDGVETSTLLHFSIEDIIYEPQPKQQKRTQTAELEEQSKTVEVPVDVGGEVLNHAEQPSGKVEAIERITQTEAKLQIFHSKSVSESPEPTFYTQILKVGHSTNTTASGSKLISVNASTPSVGITSSAASKPKILSVVEKRRWKRFADCTTNHNHNQHNNSSNNDSTQRSALLEPFHLSPSTGSVHISHANSEHSLAQLKRQAAGDTFTCVPLKAHLCDNQYHSLPDVNIGQSLKVSECIDAKLRSSYNLHRPTSTCDEPSLDDYCLLENPTTTTTTLLLEHSCDDSQLQPGDSHSNADSVTSAEIYDSIKRFGRAHQKAREKEAEELNAALQESESKQSQQPPLFEREVEQTTKELIIPVQQDNNKLREVQVEKDSNDKDIKSNCQREPGETWEEQQFVSDTRDFGETPKSAPDIEVANFSKLIERRAKEIKEYAKRQRSAPKTLIGEAPNVKKWSELEHVKLRSTNAESEGKRELSGGFRIIVTDAQNNVIEEDAIVEVETKAQKEVIHGKENSAEGKKSDVFDSVNFTNECGIAKEKRLLENINPNFSDRVNNFNEANNNQRCNKNLTQKLEENVKKTSSAALKESVVQNFAKQFRQEHDENHKRTTNGDFNKTVEQNFAEKTKNSRNSIPNIDDNKKDKSSVDTQRQPKQNFAEKVTNFNERPNTARNSRQTAVSSKGVKELREENFNKGSNIVWNSARDFEENIRVTSREVPTKRTEQNIEKEAKKFNGNSDIVRGSQQGFEEKTNWTSEVHQVLDNENFTEKLKKFAEKAENTSSGRNLAQQPETNAPRTPSKERQKHNLADKQSYTDKITENLNKTSNLAQEYKENANPTSNSSDTILSTDKEQSSNIKQASKTPTFHENSTIPHTLTHINKKFLNSDSNNNRNRGIPSLKRVPSKPKRLHLHTQTSCGPQEQPHKSNTTENCDSGTSKSKEHRVLSTQIYKARPVKVLSNSDSFRRAKMSRPQILQVVDNKRKCEMLGTTTTSDSNKSNKMASSQVESEYLKKVDAVRSYWSKLTKDENTSENGEHIKLSETRQQAAVEHCCMSNDEQVENVVDTAQSSCQKPQPEPRHFVLGSSTQSATLNNAKTSPDDFCSFMPSIEIVELDGDKKATIVSTAPENALCDDETNEPQFDHIRYKVLKSQQLLRSNILPRSKKEAQFDGLIQYLQEYSFQELLSNSNVVIVEPVRTKIERPLSWAPTANKPAPTHTNHHKSKDDSQQPQQGDTNSEAHNKNVGSKHSATSNGSSGGIKRHFFYQPVRVNRELYEEELPNPDVVRNVRKFFEEHILPTPGKGLLVRNDGNSGSNQSQDDSAVALQQSPRTRRARKFRYLTIDTSYGHATATQHAIQQQQQQEQFEKSQPQQPQEQQHAVHTARKWDTASLSSGISSGDLSSPCECNDNEANHQALLSPTEQGIQSTKELDNGGTLKGVHVQDVVRQHNNRLGGSKIGEASERESVPRPRPRSAVYGGRAATYQRMIYNCQRSNEMSANDADDDDEDDNDDEHDYDDLDESYYVSKDVLEKIRECGSSVTYYGGRVLQCNSPDPQLWCGANGMPQNQPQPKAHNNNTNTLTRRRARQIETCSVCQPHECPHKEQLQQMFAATKQKKAPLKTEKTNSEAQQHKREVEEAGIKFKLVKSNSCSSRLELAGADASAATVVDSQVLAEETPETEVVKKMVHHFECNQNQQVAGTKNVNAVMQQENETLLTINNQMPPVRRGSNSNTTNELSASSNETQRPQQVTVNNHINVPTTDFEPQEEHPQQQEAMNVPKQPDEMPETYQSTAMDIRLSQANKNANDKPSNAEHSTVEGTTAATKVWRNKNVDLAITMVKQQQQQQHQPKSTQKPQKCKQTTPEDIQQQPQQSIELAEYVSTMTPHNCTNNKNNNENSSLTSTESQAYAQPAQIIVPVEIHRVDTATTLTPSPSSSSVASVIDKSLVRQYVANDKRLFEARKYDDIEFEEFEVYDPAKDYEKLNENEKTQEAEAATEAANEKHSAVVAMSGDEESQSRLESDCYDSLEYKL